MKWTPIDVVVAILSTAVAVALIAPIVEEGPLNADQLATYEKVIGAVIALLGVYIGKRIKD